MDGFTRDGLTFDVRDDGPPDGPAVVLLHGFPQDASAYDAVVPLLAAAGLRTLAPDQRGYSPRARPPGRRASTLRQLVADVVALLDAAGVAQAHVVGHDWGGTVAWAVASRRPGRVASLTVLGTPHPRAMRDGMRHGQARRSWYVAAFQVPWLPERALLAGGGARLRQALVDDGLEPDRADRYVARLRDPGALTAALAWYRALGVRHAGSAGRVRVPTTYVTAGQDPFFAPASVEATGRYVDGPFTRVDLDADHWLPEHRPAEVAEAVLARVSA
ncbi:alpha/beta hydrolase fold protein [Cellulomonas flavigena DSM 20109]|uniref:Alpha/beta hydrolase fold protein n=1 Tax=Cellulomonas flavigena (strain ATCC 482 / DSM 20109 / BCRC 11376 / JCM 18109 / NBRC 3775 / NCIMB 8073 / NRS 134) TaxID=446466 RepID=D5UKE8_CELFN|nr:alpha/beta fold hydrolase [Cellulomonas flavigena]ADG75809.1 alpha/beta hydrolase fold protein [Cellulomonas flavigena DSM 20109]